MRNPEEFCPACGYPLGAGKEGGQRDCPECGAGLEYWRDAWRALSRRATRDVRRVRFHDAPHERLRIPH